MTFATIVHSIIDLVNHSVIPLLFAFAFLFFLINIVRFFFIEGGDEGIEKGKKAVLWGLIGLVVLFCVWGIVTFLLNSLNSITGTPATTPANTQTQTQTTGAAPGTQTTGAAPGTETTGAAPGQSLPPISQDPLPPINVQ